MYDQYMLYVREKAYASRYLLNTNYSHLHELFTNLNLRIAYCYIIFIFFRFSFLCVKSDFCQTFKIYGQINRTYVFCAHHHVMFPYMIIKMTIKMLHNRYYTNL